MEFFNKVYLLKKESSSLGDDYSLFFKNSGLEYAGQFSNPDVFYSASIGGSACIILFDPSDFGDRLDYVCQLLGSLQSYTGSYIVLCDDLPSGYDVPFSPVECNEKIKDKKIRITDCILKVLKEERSNPNGEKAKLYSNLRDILIELGFDASDLGFGYICDSVYYILKQNKPNVKLVGEVYKHVARVNNTLDYRVERDVRHAIEHAMVSCNHQALANHPKLKSFDSLMLRTTSKSLILALVSFIKYDIVIS